MEMLEEIRDYVSGQIGDTSTDALVEIDRWINLALGKLCSKYIWSGYTRTKTITPDSDGELFVPPSFAGVIMVWPYDETFSYFDFLSGSSKRRTRLGKSYYMNGESRVVDGGSESSISMTNGDTTVTTTGSIFASTDVGKVLLIGSGYEYEITDYTDEDNIEFSPAFRGETGTYRVVVRPASVRKLIIYDSYNTAYTSDIMLAYKIAPQKLYNDYDRPAISADEALRKGALIEALVEEKYNIDAARTKDDYKEAIMDARNSEIRPVKRSLPEGLYGGLPCFSFKSNIKHSGAMRNDEV